MTSELDRWFSPRIRAELEQLYYAEVNTQARFERLSRDPTFLESIQHGAHVGLYADHGVVHVRDVAGRVITVLERVHGLLIPRRPAWRFTIMQGYGVLLAYFHDIGMFDFSAFGRAMHPEFATRSVFNPQLDSVIDAMWEENSANLAWRLTRLAEAGALEQPPRMVFRELLALSIGHSKSKVPVAVLNDPAQLRDTLVEAASTDLHYLYSVQRVRRARQKLLDARLGEASAEETARLELALEGAENALLAYQAQEAARNPDLRRYYKRVPDEAFLWLLSTEPSVRELFSDAVDTVRALRCADALRQRGDVLKTSGGYEIFISQQTANAVYSLQQGNDSLYLLELDVPISAGEANVAGSELDGDGNLRISFHRGVFATDEATAHAVRSAAMVVDDVQLDAIDSFTRPPDETGGECLKRAADIQLLLEEVDDSAAFVARVRARLEIMHPNLRGRIRLVPSLQAASDRERQLYLRAEEVDWDEPTRRDLLARLQRSGHRVDEIDISRAFQDVRLVELRSGDVLLEAGAPAVFVYIPLGTGLRILPLGGYEALDAHAWTPLGVTGVVRGAQRNATVVAEAPLRLLMIPKGVYMREWHFTHSPATMKAAIEALPDSTGPGAGLSPLERAGLLQRVPLFTSVPHDALLAIAAAAEEMAQTAGATLVEKGALGDALFIVVAGEARVMDGDVVLATLGASDVFGELSVLTPEPRMASVIAVTDIRLLRLPADAFQRFLGAHSDVATAIITELAARLRRQAAELSAGKGNKIR